MDIPTLSSPLLFISDVHLGGFAEKENERIESELVQLISFCERNNIQLAILGDLFDYWMEYPDTVPSLGQQLLRRFEEYNRQFGPTLYITGNHDNWTRGHFSDRGFYVEPESFSLKLGSKSVLLLHGDGLTDPNLNLERPLMHRVLRSPQFIRLFQSIFSASTGINIMKYFSRLNRRFDDQSADGSDLNNWAANHLQKTNTDLIISGHDHIPRKKQFAFGCYINLGTFCKHRTMAYYNNNTIQIVSWEPESQTLQPFDSTTDNR